MLAGRHGAHAVARESPIQRREKIDTLEPPMSEQFRVERRGHYRQRRPGRMSPLDVLGRFVQHADEVIRMTGDRGAGGRRVVPLLAAQVHRASSHPPQSQAVGPADFVELEVPLIAGIALGARPDLPRGARIADERIEILGASLRRCNAVGNVRGPLTAQRSGRVVHIGIAERGAGADEMRIDEEVPIPRRRQMLIGSRAIRLRVRPGWAPWTTGPIRALWQPASPRRPAKQALVLGDADGELQTNGLVAREQRQEPVGRG